MGFRKSLIVMLVLLVPLVSAQAGDVNGDLMVDLNDLIFMTLNLGNSGFDPAADINSDGQVNIFDMVVVARNYGNDYSSGGSLVDECNNLDPNWIWCDDFEVDRTMRPPAGGYFEYNTAGGRFVRDSTSGVNNSYGMRATYSTSSSDAGWLSATFGRSPDGVSGYRVPISGTENNNYTEVYWRFYVWHPSTWVVNSDNFKLTRAHVWAEPSTWAQAAVAHIWSGGANNEYVILDAASGTDVAGNLQTTGWNDFNNFRWIGGQQVGSTPIFSSSEVGQWRCVEAHMRLNDPGTTNGELRYWIDDNLEAQATNMNWVGDTNTFTDYGINNINLETEWNNGAPVVQDRYFDNFVISTQRIGCGVNPPPPPSCGDSSCNGGETCSTCPGDCGACGPTCGDSTCDAGETCSSCPGDCGACSSTTVDFDNPTAPNPLNGIFQGIDFGTGQWWETGAYGSNPTNHIFFSADVSSRDFSFVTPSVLNSMNVYAGTTSGTLTLSDDNGQSFNQVINPGSLILVNTGWTQLSSTVTVDFTATWDLGVDDITYSDTGQSCSCGSWADNACGAGSCASDEMQQTRTCTPSACVAETQCVSDPSCTAPPVCPDGTCNGAETCSSCPADCGVCTVCPNSVCESGETCSSCPADCGVCTGPNVFFSCDWPTTGTSTAAIRDCTDVDWPRYFSPAFEVIADPYNFPTDNIVLWTTSSAASGVGFDYTDNIMPTMGLGDVQYIRFYFRYLNEETANPMSDDNTHGIFTQVADFPASDVGWDFPVDIGTSWTLYHQSTPAAGVLVSHEDGTSGLPTVQCDITPAVPYDTTVMVQTRMEITSVNPDVVRLDSNITDLQGNTLAQTDGNCLMPLQNGAEALNSFYVAFNGYTGGTGQDYAAFAGLAICDDWCGPYPIAGVED